MKRLLLFVEGDGDEEAVPILVGKFLTEFAYWDVTFLDPEPFRIREVAETSGKRVDAWLKHLRFALKKRDLAAILTVLDGDAKCKQGVFCAAEVAKTLVERARETGAGTTYSLGVVFARQEYESWLLAGIESLAGKSLSDGSPGVRAGTGRIGDELEAAPRDAKKLLGQKMPNGYKPTIHQAELTRLLDLDTVRRRGMKSFARLERVVRQLGDAIRTGQHVATPA